jgi:hypothetical protein
MPHQAVRIDSTRTLHVTYVSGFPFGGDPLRVRHASATIGGPWVIETVGPDNTGVLFGATLALGSSDTLHVAYERGSEVRYARKVCHS